MLTTLEGLEPSSTSLLSLPWRSLRWYCFQHLSNAWFLHHLKQLGVPIQPFVCTTATPHLAFPSPILVFPWILQKQQRHSFLTGIHHTWYRNIILYLFPKSPPPNNVAYGMFHKPHTYKSGFRCRCSMMSLCCAVRFSWINWFSPPSLWDTGLTTFNNHGTLDNRALCNDTSRKYMRPTLNNVSSLCYRSVFSPPEEESPAIFNSLLRSLWQLPALSSVSHLYLSALCRLKLSPFLLNISVLGNQCHKAMFQL